MKQLILIFAVGILVTSCDSGSSLTPKQIDSIQVLAAKKTDSIIKDDYKSAYSSTYDSIWTYKTDTDKMTSKLKIYADVQAKDQLQLKFPYNGGVTAQLSLRFKDGENNSYLTLSNGQF